MTNTTRKFTDDQIRAAMATEGTIVQKAAAIGIHFSTFLVRARKLGLLEPARKRDPRGKPKANGKPADRVTGTPAPEQEAAPPRQFYASRDLEKAAREPGPVPTSLPGSLADSGTELSRMAGIVQGFAALSATGRAWVLARIQAA
ncbi:MAG: hypothetical protein NTU93_00095 [Arthrobacter sp.]|nr:hypothetical protein [Arthrobacter sp.]